MHRLAAFFGVLALLVARTSFAQPSIEVHVPEPMRFDLVRGLGARTGELEANVLSSFGASSAQPQWAPELEWVPLDGFGAELELPARGDEIEAVKPSLQWTLPGFDAPLAHGLQLSTAIARDGHHGAHAIWILAARLARSLAVVASVGPRLEWSAGAPPRALGLLNVAFFTPLGHHAVGIEINLARAAAWRERAVSPQVHLAVDAHVRMQLGVGALSLGDAQAWEPAGFLRVVLER